MKKNIIKVKRFQKPLICLIGILLVLLGVVIDRFMSTNADEINYEYQSNNIGYDSTNNSLNATNVKDALDELYEKVGQCPNGIYCYVENKSFKKAYTYDESTCITGDETGCVETKCYENGTCSVGTIIDYEVSSSDVVRFHVLHDDGATMTLQSQKNTVYSTAWRVGSNNTSNGPITIMAALKTATKNWVNVNPITITSSTTSFIGIDSINNLCTNDSTGIVTCSSNKYDIGNIVGTYKARMITMQEAIDSNIGQCKAWVSNSLPNNISCRMFMNNFLHESTYSGHCANAALCVNDDHTENGAEHNLGYWTMGAISSVSAWRVSRAGYVNAPNTSNIDSGARAVVVVNK